MALIRCFWCAKDRRRMSEWEQDHAIKGWHRLCAPCARKRLRNPYNALLRMRRITAAKAADTPG